ncbi:uncharacterized protein C8Q71DRAFT_763951 [Rhodofomes roseus]|uniref:Uncharacterized protein n=1 Tax=Rhodofomes roseus TaxID=34475 RepID=A0ABQ8KE39_9APHY|nr:uncharacterized protein C8Q71DRAFT_763951 [Rhodofomes roseus]KAH9835916.1 hypothetical protein C8Q71DRAFT_763951 [Rhodofomes roseus]
MPSEYHLQSFWEQRFTTEPHFEWLGDGQETLLPRLRTFLCAEAASRAHRTANTPPRLLHIGAGSSTLSQRILEAYEESYGQASWDESTIVNLDFSEVAVQNGQQAEIARTQEGAGRSMRWVQADVLQWGDLAPLVDWRHGLGDVNGGPFALVVDKSTSDAIACGEDIVLTASPSRCHPAIQRHIPTSDIPGGRVDPVALLALNLAPLVRPGGLWIILSFSSSRVSFLGRRDTKNTRSSMTLDPALYWSLEEHDTVDAPTGLSKEGVHAPPVQHHVYILRRSSKLLDIRW